MRSDTFFASYPYNISIIDLGDFDDLYYATCAKLKELLHGVDVLLTNGFKRHQDAYLTYHEKPLCNLGPITISAFKSSLLVHESILYSDKLQNLLDEGIMKKHMRNTIHKSHHHFTFGGSASQHGVHQHVRENTKINHDSRRSALGQTMELLASVQGLQDKSNMSCGMIFGELAEKYRPFTMNTEQEGLLIDRNSTPEAPQAFQGHRMGQYISPYNLEERAKKLNAPGGPEMPCICDPECMCAPLCASDPSLNCLCEENGLFARVTEGMDIDDLDVPDLVRRKRPDSMSSRSSTVSVNSVEGTSPAWPVYRAGYYSDVAPIRDQYEDMDEAENRRVKHRGMISDHGVLSGTTWESPSQRDDVVRMNGTLAPSEEEEEFWEPPVPQPLRVSSLSYREALTQPFSKRCDYPPKRSSVTQRLFNTGSSSLARQRKPLADTLPTQNQNTNGNTGKVGKQGKKRSLADISFTGLKIALRRDSRNR